ncbi:MAG: response regulator transcription factor [Acholeplasmatales bacterium]|nr:response regulator transcription factor [Acholeplasmatales bacterium]
MRIAICDDNKIELETTSAIASKCLDYYNIPATIDTFNDPKYLLNKITQFNEYYDVYLLDIVMQENGINVAEKIRDFHKNPNIIFTTTSKEFAIDAFTVKAHDYLLKPIDKDRFYKCISEISNSLSKKKTFFSIKTNDLSIVNINISDINFIESYDRRINIHLVNSEIITSTTLRNRFLEYITFDLDEHKFVASHKSYVVNMNQIKSINDAEFTMKNGVVVPISKKLFSEVKQKYIKYLIGD